MMKSFWNRYTEDDHLTWGRLLVRQREILAHRACDELLGAELALSPHAIPRFEDLNQVLGARTGWTITPVTGLLTDRDFFAHLASRVFPVTWWIRKPEQLDYLEEPDLFHDLFGHVPLLIQPSFAHLMQAFGRAGVAAADEGPGPLECLTRLYWFTVEFGLIATRGGLRLYGAGIASSKEESVYCIESPIPHRLVFSPERAMRTGYRLDAVQQTYFVIDDFAQLKILLEDQLLERCIAASRLPTIPAGVVLPSDRRLEQVGTVDPRPMFDLSSGVACPAPGW